MDMKSFNLIRIKLGVVVEPVIPALERLKQEDHEFESSLGYTVSSTVRPCFKNQNKYRVK
jgi:hypothetical protein